MTYIKPIKQIIMIRNFNADIIPSLVRNAKSYLTSMSGIPENLRVPEIEFGKTYYKAGEGFNAIRFDCIVIRQGRWGVETLAVYHTPDGEIHIQEIGDMAFFKDIANFKEYCRNGGRPRNDSQSVDPKETYFKGLYDSMESYVSHVDLRIFNAYQWIAGKVRETTISIERMWIDKDGGHLSFHEGDNLYETKEECFDDNFRIVDGYFSEDDKEPEKVVEFEVLVPIKVMATSMEEAHKIAEDKLSELE